MTLLPTCTLPKLVLAGLALRTPGVNPSPESETLSAELRALLMTERLPLSDPPDGGVNPRLKLALWPGVRVIGKFNPLVLNPVPETLTWETVTLELPQLVRVSD